MTILALAMSRQHVGRDQLARAIIVVGIVRLAGRAAGPDGDAGGDDQKAAANSQLAGERTALTVCQAISMAITVVLPAPVAIFMREAQKFGVGLLVGSPRMCPGYWRSGASFGATSVSQMTVSTASIWQKKGRTPSNYGAASAAAAAPSRASRPSRRGWAAPASVSTCRVSR